MNEIFWQKIEEIKNQTHCPHNFSCLAPQNQIFGTRKRIGDTELFECERLQPNGCDHIVHFGNRWYCNCPVCLYMNKNH